MLNIYKSIDFTSVLTLFYAISAVKKIRQTASQPPAGTISLNLKQTTKNESYEPKHLFATNIRNLFVRFSIKIQSAIITPAQVRAIVEALGEP